VREIQDKLNKVLEAIQLVDYPGALATLEETELKLPCVAEIVPTSVLSRLFVYRGLTMFYLGNTELARVAFTRALAIEQTLKWDPRWGSKPRETFLDARAAQLTQLETSRPEPVRCPMLATGVQAYINGRELTQGTSTPLLSGVHFLQIRWPDGRWEGTLFEVASGRDIPLPLPKQALLADTAAPTPAVQPTTPSTGEGRRPNDSSNPPSASQETKKVERSRGWVPFVGTSVVAVGSSALWVKNGLTYFQTRSELFSGDYYSDVDSDEKDLLLAANQKAARRANLAGGLTVLSVGASIFLFPRVVDDGVALDRVSPLLLPGGGGLALSGHF
jgi:hypothetical protein